MTRERLADFVPTLYGNILPEIFESPLAEERHATCEECAMCMPSEPLFSPEHYFSEETRCCTYFPSLPNFAVGGLLSDRGAKCAEGRRRVLAAVEARIGTSPIGIRPPRKQVLLYRHGRSAFGRSRALACPYFDSDRGHCTVWEYREAVCSTWFCKYNDGQDGFDFWKQLLRYMLGMQRVLVLHALRELQCEPSRFICDGDDGSSLDRYDLDDEPPSEKAYTDLWGEWVGREPQFFMRCYEIVTELDRKSFRILGGIDNDIALSLLRKRYLAVREPRLPDRLVKNPEMKVERLSDGSYLLTSYLAGDQIRMRKRLFDLLECFDGRAATGRVRFEIRARTGLNLSDALLTRLHQHRILVIPENR